MKNKMEYRDRSALIAQMPSAQFTAAFALSWSQYIFLISIRNKDERRFYEIEAARGA